MVSREAKGLGSMYSNTSTAPSYNELQPYFHRFFLADLIQEGSLGVMRAVEDFDFTDPQGHFFPYVTACIRHALTRLLPRDGLLSIHRLEFWKLAQQGRLKEWRSEE